MIRLHSITKSFGKHVLLENISLQMEPESRLGLIGRNGTGKTTLFKILLHEEGIDSGEIIQPKNYRISHLSQRIGFNKPTVLEVGCQGLSPEEKYDHYKVEEILFGLGFSDEDLKRDPHELSGGFQVRLSLAKALVSRPNLLLLDEPTNYLDIVAIRWVTRFIRSWKNEMIIISHDREFLDNVTTHSAIIHRNNILMTKGGTAKLEGLIDQYEEHYEKQRIAEEKQRKQLQTFIDKNYANPATAMQARSRRRMLEKLPDRQKLETLYNLEFDFRFADFPGKRMMEVEGLSFHYDPRFPLIKDLKFDVEARDRIAVIGKNGKGKSTLMRLLAGELMPVEGSIKPSINMSLGYFGQTNIDRLNPELSVEGEVEMSNPNLGRTVVRGICGVMMFSGDEALKKVSLLSGGEKSRVLLAKILATPTNCLFLDEPTNHLDVQSVEALVESIEDFPGAVIIVTHDEMILRRIAKKLLIFQHGNAELFHGGYDDFLRRIGWEEEKGLDGKKAKVPQRSKKELRQERGRVINEKSKVLKPIKDDITRLEDEICKLEKKLEDLNSDLKVAVDTQSVGKITSISEDIAEAQKYIDRDFARLEKLAKLHDEKNTYFDELLEEV